MPHFPGFEFVLGFVGCIALAGLAKTLGAVLHRRKSYYPEDRE